MYHIYSMCYSELQTKLVFKEAMKDRAKDVIIKLLEKYNVKIYIIDKKKGKRNSCTSFTFLEKSKNSEFSLSLLFTQGSNPGPHTF